MQRLIWFIGLIVLFLVGDRIGAYVLGKMTSKSQFRYSRMYEGRGAADILLIGNSRGLTLYQPAIEDATKKSTINLSYNGMPINLATALGKDYIDQYKPERLILEITTCDRWNNALITGFLPYLKYSPRLGKLMKDSISDAYYGAQLTHLFRYNGEVFQRALNYLSYDDETWIPDRTIGEAAIANIENDKFEIKLDPNYIKDLADLVKTAQAHQVEVKLVVAPYFPGYKPENRGIPALIQAVKTATGLPVFDYSQAISNPQLFSDFMHPNKEGSYTYVKLMQADGVLP